VSSFMPFIPALANRRSSPPVAIAPNSLMTTTTSTSPVTSGMSSTTARASTTTTAATTTNARARSYGVGTDGTPMTPPPWMASRSWQASSSSSSSPPPPSSSASPNSASRTRRSRAAAYRELIRWKLKHGVLARVEFTNCNVQIVMRINPLQETLMDSLNSNAMIMIDESNAYHMGYNENADETAEDFQIVAANHFPATLIQNHGFNIWNELELDDWVF